MGTPYSDGRHDAHKLVQDWQSTSSSSAEEYAEYLKEGNQADLEDLNHYIEGRGGQTRQENFDQRDYLQGIVDVLDTYSS